MSSRSRWRLSQAVPALAWGLMGLGLAGCAAQLGWAGATGLPRGIDGPVFAGLALAILLPAGWRPARPMRALVGLCALAAVAWGGAAVFGEPGYFNMQGPRPPGAVGNLRPTALLACALAAMALLCAEVGGLRASRLARACSWICAAAGVGGLGMELLDVEYLSLLPQAAQMEGADALGCALAGLALGIRARPRREPGREVEAVEVLRVLDWLLAGSVAAVAVGSFALAQGRTERQMLEQLAHSSSERRLFFESQLRGALDMARQASERPELGDQLKSLQEKRARGEEPAAQDMALLASTARKTRAQGYARYAFLGLDGRVYAEEGAPVGKVLMTADLWGDPRTKLIWREGAGYATSTDLPLQGLDGASVGRVQAERPLPELTSAQREATERGRSGDMIVCSGGSDSIACFPFRWRREGGVYPARSEGRPKLMARAARGEVTAEISEDYRGERVVAAIGPVGSSGLGLGTKMDAWEVYSPIRRQFYLALPFFALLGLAAMGLARMSLHPLVQRIERSRDAQRHAATHDALTGLPNRALFVDRLELALARSRRSGSLLAALYVDLDGFKQINDVHGHAAGDKMLIWFGEALKESVRATDTVARLSGDEFAVVLEDVGTAAAARAVAEGILARLASGEEPPDGLPRAQASVGGAFARGGQGAPAELLRRADMLLYEAKRAGRGRASFESDPELGV